MTPGERPPPALCLTQSQRSWAAGPTIRRRRVVVIVRRALDTEADGVAELVMRMPENVTEPRSDASELPAASFSLAKQPQTVEGGTTISDTVAHQLAATRGNGSSMHTSIRGFMESRFGADFSAVRIHTGEYAAQMSRELGAQAFTVGNDIYFDAGRYVPEQQRGQQLLAHELAHTLQRHSAGKVLRSCTTDPPTANEAPLVTDGILRSFSHEASANRFIRNHPELVLVCHRIERNGVVSYVIYRRVSAPETTAHPPGTGRATPTPPSPVGRRIVVTLNPLGAVVFGVEATPHRLRILSSGRSDHPTHVTTRPQPIDLQDQEHRSSAYGRCYDNPPFSLVTAGRTSCVGGIYVGNPLSGGVRDTQNGRCYARHRTVTDRQGTRHQVSVHSREGSRDSCRGDEVFIGASMRFFQRYFIGADGVGEGFHVGDTSPSHGCLHLSESDATWLWRRMRMGDLVEVRARPPAPPRGPRH